MELMTTYKQLVLGVLKISRDTALVVGEEGRQVVYDAGAEMYNPSSKADLAIAQNVLGYLMDNRVKAVFFDEELVKNHGGIKAHKNPEITIAFDDIDGTDNWRSARGLAPSTSIVAVFDSPREPRYSDLVAAGIVEINSGKLWYAESGKGVTLDGKHVKCSGRTDFSGKEPARIGFDHYALIGTNEHVDLNGLSRVAWVKDYATSGGHYASLVGGKPDGTGSFDGWVNLRQKEHELGAGYLFVKEGGGWIAELDKDNPMALDSSAYDFNGKRRIVAAGTEQMGMAIINTLFNKK